MLDMSHPRDEWGGDDVVREVFREAGFTHFRCAAQTPIYLIIEAKV
jgi:hypothetical protein